MKLKTKCLPLFLLCTFFIPKQLQNLVFPFANIPTFNPLCITPIHLNRCCFEGIKSGALTLAKFQLLKLFGYTCAQAESFKLSYETLSASEIEKNPKYQNLKQFDPGRHQTIIKVHGLPESESYVLKLERPLFVKSLRQQEYTKKALSQFQEMVGEDQALSVISSRYVLPGEKIYVTLETKDGASTTDKIAITPHPIVLEIPGSAAKLKAELTNFAPTYYELYFEGILTAEKLKFVSCSSGETVDQEIDYRPGSCIALLPEVLGKKGGFCDLTLIRPNGEAFKLHLPWGEEILEYSNKDKDPIILEFTPISSNNAIQLK